MEGGKWDLGKEGDIAEINNLLSLVRMLSEIPARERNQPEPRDRTGQNFGRAEGAVFRDSERDMAVQGRQLDSTSKQVNSELVRLLSGLHGLQSETLRMVATHPNNTELLARDLAVIKRKVESQSRATSLGFNQQPGN